MRVKVLEIFFLLQKSFHFDIYIYIYSMLAYFTESENKEKMANGGER